MRRTTQRCRCNGAHRRAGTSGNAVTGLRHISGGVDVGGGLGGAGCQGDAIGAAAVACL